MSLAVAARLARRELRGGLRGFRIFLACLALGVAAIAAVGTVRASIEAGLAREGAALLGAGGQRCRAAKRGGNQSDRSFHGLTLVGKGKVGYAMAPDRFHIDSTSRSMSFASCHRCVEMRMP